MNKTSKSDKLVLKLGPDGKYHISASMLDQIAIQLPPSVQGVPGLKVVLAESRTQRTFGLTTEDFNVRLTNINDIRVIAALKRNLALTDKQEITKVRHDKFEQIYLQLRGLVGEDFRPNTNLKTEIFNLWLSVQAMQERFKQISGMRPADEIEEKLQIYLRNQFYRSFCAIELRMTALAKGESKSLLAYLFDQKVTRWFYSRFSSTNTKIDVTKSIISILFPKKANTGLRLTVPEIKEFNEDLFEPTKIMLDLLEPIFTERLSKDRKTTSIEGLSFQAFPKISPKRILLTGYQVTSLSSPTEYNRIWNAVYQRYFGFLSEAEIPREFWTRYYGLVFDTGTAVTQQQVLQLIRDRPQKPLVYHLFHENRSSQLKNFISQSFPFRRTEMNEYLSHKDPDEPFDSTNPGEFDFNFPSSREDDKDTRVIVDQPPTVKVRQKTSFEINFQDSYPEFVITPIEGYQFTIFGQNDYIARRDQFLQEPVYIENFAFRKKKPPALNIIAKNTRLSKLYQSIAKTDEIAHLANVVLNQISNIENPALQDHAINIVAGKIQALALTRGEGTLSDSEESENEEDDEFKFNEIFARAK